jgi:hypothetical protein
MTTPENVVTSDMVQNSHVHADGNNIVWNAFEGMEQQETTTYLKGFKVSPFFPLANHCR